MKLGANREEVADRVAGGVVAVGVLGAPFYNTGALHATAASSAVLAVLCLGLALAWRSLLHRDYAWADPARLTWADFDDGRVGALTRRLLLGWGARFAGVAYLAVVTAILTGANAAYLAAGAALFLATALFALVTARRRPGRILRFAEPAVALALAVLGLLSAVPLPWFWTAAGVLAFAALALDIAPGVLVAPSAGRADLVRRFTERMVRRTSVSMLDPWALLPAPSAVSGLNVLGGRFVVGRFVLLGALARGRSALPAVVLALAVVVLHRVFPGVPPPWWVGVGGYLAALPFAGSVAQLSRVPGLRRWLGCTDRTLLLTAVGVLVPLMAVWLGAAVALGLPWSWRLAVTLVLAVAAVVRTVTRPMLDFANLGLVSLEGVLIPAGLIFQLVRGPDLLVVGTFLLAVLT